MSNSATEQPATLTRAEIFEGLSQEVVFARNGDEVALVGSAWYRSANNGITWKLFANGTTGAEMYALLAKECA